MYNREKAIELCNIGIAEKRNGNFRIALDYYEKAKEHDPEFIDIYKNSVSICH